MEARMMMYYQALAELDKSCHAFATSIVKAAEASKHAPETDDPIALETLERCRAALTYAFGSAPGMMQIFQPPEALKDAKEARA